MESNEILRTLTGLQKKHGDSFRVSIKYMTDGGKVRKRSGCFTEMTADGVLILYNEEKKSTGRYFLDRIRSIEKKITKT